MTAAEVIQQLDLRPLPDEGGYYKEVYRSTDYIPQQAIPKYPSKRNHATAIYYLITATEFSSLHRLRTDEIYHFYAGDTVEMVQIEATGKLKKVMMDNSLSPQVRPQVVVPANVWQGCRVAPGGEWALMGCTTAPGFEFEDFEFGVYQTLINIFPQHQDIIRCFTRI